MFEVKIMEQGLKQRLIGAIVITSLAAIFVPMLFDDPIDETGKLISELKIPDAPAESYPIVLMKSLCYLTPWL
jgi:DedD protein